jgi:serine/threonine-protein kinase
MTDITSRLSAALADRYRIERRLGEGGMATVYLAEDLKHDRKVALKVLKPELAAVLGAERFVQEIKTTASLQHPHILPLFDSGEVDSFLYYVMPYVEGETLRDKLNREKQLRIDEAVGIATEVADALEYAHQQGVIHRDIKPENILLHGGRPMVADFGIALAVSAAAGGRMTETGLSLGTPHYMSPEQATAEKHLTGRSDIYSLGAVLYEMLTGNPPHVGSTAQQIIAQIIADEAPPVTELRKSVPPNVAAAVGHALEKLPADRFATAQDFIAALRDPAFRTPQSPDATMTRTWNRAAVGFAAVSVLLGVAFVWSMMRSAPTGPMVRFALQRPPGMGQGNIVDVLPDGSGAVMTYRAESGEMRLWLHRWTDGSVLSLEDDFDVYPDYPAVSPDAEWVAYHDHPALKVTSLTGGSTRTLVGDKSGSMLRWDEDGYIYFNANDFSGPIRRVHVSGGPVEDVTVLRDGDGGHGWFHLLPGGETGLFTVRGPPPRIEAIDLRTGERTIVTEGGRSYYTETGHLVFGSADGRVLAAPFDVKHLRLEAAPEAVLSEVRRAGDVPEYWLASDGTLLYFLGESSAPRRAQLVWVDRSGRNAPLDPDWTITPGSTNLARYSVSPDGKSVVYRDAASPGGDIWVKEVDTGVLSRLTFGESRHATPAWSADGDSVYFASDRRTGDVLELWIKAADGVGDARLVAESDRDIEEIEPSRAGEWVLFRVDEGQVPNTRDIFGIRPGIDTVAVPLIADPDVHENSASISPDGRWVVYAEGETTEQQVFVRPFPDTERGRWQIPVDVDEAVGWTRWSHSGDEIFLMAGNSAYVARVQTEPTFRVLTVEELFEWQGGIPYVANWTNNGLWDVHPDNQRFLMAWWESGPPADLILVQNFLTEIERRVRESR